MMYPGFLCHCTHWLWTWSVYRAPLGRILLITGVSHCSFLCSVLFYDQITSDFYVSGILQIYVGILSSILKNVMVSFFQKYLVRLFNRNLWEKGGRHMFGLYLKLDKHNVPWNKFSFLWQEPTNSSYQSFTQWFYFSEQILRDMSWHTETKLVFMWNYKYHIISKMSCSRITYVNYDLPIW